MCFIGNLHSHLANIRITLSGHGLYINNRTLICLFNSPIKYSIICCQCRSHNHSGTFSAEEKKQFIERLKKLKIPSSHSPTALQKAAVLVPLCRIRGEISLLYTLRSQDLKKHKGLVSFPGGKQDIKDLDLEATALRESEEELGILKTSIDVLGHGNTVTGREFSILPVIGYIGEIELDTLKPNPKEVDFAFTVPLQHFYESKNCRYTQYRNGSGYVLPVFINTERKIWGVTALITHIVLRALSPQNYFNNLSLIKPII